MPTTTAPSTASTSAPTAPARPSPTPDARPAINTPAWLRDAAIYQIFPRSFYDSNGDGIGDLNGIRAKLDYIQALGANTLWITPHYPATTYHGYDVTDYKSVQPQFGTLDDFKALTAELHRRNMRLFVDFVANHSSNAHPFFKDALRNPSSPYSKWYKFRDAQNSDYESFFGVTELPEWNVDKPEVRSYLLDAARFWLDAGADGLRCDYALGPGRAFWRDFSAALKSSHPNAALLGEVWDADPGRMNAYLNGGFDALFDFPWYLSFAGSADAINSGVSSGREPVNLLLSAHLVTQIMYPRGAQLVRFINNHDTNRVASAVNGDPTRMRLAAAMLYLSPGIPMIYYGEEIGMNGVKGRGPQIDEYRREPMDWYRAETGVGMTNWFKPADRANKANDGISIEEQDAPPDSLLNFYRTLAKFRVRHPSLSAEDFEVIETPTCTTCISILRRDKTSGQLAWIAFNLSAEQVMLSRPAEIPSTPSADALGANLSGAILTLPAWGWTAHVWPH